MKKILLLICLFISGLLFAKNSHKNPINNSCTPSKNASFSFPTNGYETGTFPIILVSNATLATEVRISKDSTFTTYNKVPQNNTNVREFPTLELSLCYKTTYYIQTRDNSCSSWSKPRKFSTRDYAKQWVRYLSHDITNPEPRTLGESLVTNAPNSEVDVFEWYIEDVSTNNQAFPINVFTDRRVLGDLNFRYLRINDRIANYLTSGHVYRVVVKGHIGAGCGSFTNSYPIVATGDEKYRNSYFIYEDSSPLTQINSRLNINKNTETNKKHSISVLSYPNPSKSGIFKLKTSGFNTNKTIQVINLNGQSILNFKLYDSETTIDLSSYKKGIYAIHVNDGITTKQLKLITK